MARERHIDYQRLHDITIEEVKACPTLAHLTDEEAEEVIVALKQFTKITYDYYKKMRESH